MNGRGEMSLIRGLWGVRTTSPFLEKQMPRTCSRGSEGDRVRSRSTIVSSPSDRTAISTFVLDNNVSTMEVATELPAMMVARGGQGFTSEARDLTILYPVT